MGTVQARAHGTRDANLTVISDFCRHADVPVALKLYMQARPELRSPLRRRRISNSRRESVRALELIARRHWRVRLIVFVCGTSDTDPDLRVGHHVELHSLHEWPRPLLP